MKTKKFLSILLAAILAMSCMAMTASAATYSGTSTGTVAITTVSTTTGVYNASGTVTVSSTWTISGTVTISGTLNISSSGTIVIASGGSLIITGGGVMNIASGGTLTVTGSLYILDSAGVCKNAGTITYGSSSTKSVASGKLWHAITFSDSQYSVTYAASETYNRTSMTVTYQLNILRDTDLSSSQYTTESGCYYEDFPHSSYDNDYYTYYIFPNDSYDSYWSTAYEAVSDSGTYYVEDGTNCYILLDVYDEDGLLPEWIDTTRAQLTVSGNLYDCTVDTNRGVWTIVPTSSLSVSIYSYAYSDLVTYFTVELPSTDSYYVKTFDGTTGSIDVEYGTTLSFTVVLEDGYTDCADSIYVYVNSALLDADDYGYFDITGPVDITTGTMASTGGVQEDITIIVLGVVSDEVISTLDSVIAFIKEIFATIKDIFQTIIEIFTGTSSLDDLWDIL